MSSECFDEEAWLCLECSHKVKASVAVGAPTSPIFPILLFLGFLLIMAGMLLLGFSALSAPLEGGRGFLFIFPFPFLFGFSFGGGEPSPAALGFLTAALAFLTLFAYLLFRALRPQ